MRTEDFEQLYADHAQSLFGFLAYRVGNRALAEDLLADTFERVLRARRAYDPSRASAKTWLYAIAMNCLRDQHRRAKAEARAVERVGVLDQPAQPDPALEGVADRDAVARGMAMLSDEEREAVALRYGGDLTVPEIAEVLGEPLTTMEGRLYRALRKLRAELSDAGPEPARG